VYETAANDFGAILRRKSMKEQFRKIKLIGNLIIFPFLFPTKFVE
jgi:hypothetical protein